jgi:hypothetical protein
MRVRTITGGDGDPYLERYYLWGWAPWNPEGSKLFPWLPGAMLHRFLRGDEDRELHNHPWKWAFSVILTGGYREERMVDGKITTYKVMPGSINIIKANDFHRVDLLQDDCWTLFVTGPKAQSWGFLHRITREFTPWRDFIAKKGLVPFEKT